jgi:quinol monooxygenase YgiN
MVVTEVKARVAESRWDDLRRMYREMTSDLERQLVRTYLLQQQDDPGLWRIVTVWVDQAALEEYRRSVDIPGAFVLFRGVGAEPVRTILDVAEHAPRA